jgi:hypothetical protein
LDSTLHVLEREHSHDNGICFTLASSACSKKKPHPAEPLAGRCARIQVLSLGYAEQPEPTKLPYLAAALRPAPALWLLGRGARMLPECSKKHAVFYGWRDQGGWSQKP